MNPLDPRSRKNLIPDGEKGKCRWCGKDVPKGRRKWCSQACVDDALIRCQPAFARRAVENRDKGVCASCGLDTEAIRHQFRRLSAIARDGVNAYDVLTKKSANRFKLSRERVASLACLWSKRKPSGDAEERFIAFNHRLKRLAEARLKRLSGELVKAGFNGVWRGRLNRSLWDADHIVEVVRGGGGCGLENYQTLCVPCHKRKTASLAARRAAERVKTTDQQSFDFTA